MFDGLLAMKMGDDGYGNIEPVDVPLSWEGQKAWIAFYDEHAAQQAPQIAAGDLAAARGASWRVCSEAGAGGALCAGCGG